MDQNGQPRKKIKLEIRSAPLALKILLALLILFSMAALTALRWVHLNLQEQTDSLLTEAAAVEYANSELERKKGELGSVQSVTEIAREELGLVGPDTVIINPETAP